MALIGELAKRVFEARDITHKAHWLTKSFAQHSALGAFYDDVIDAIDAVIEHYIGTFGDVDIPLPAPKKVTDISAYLTDELDWIDSNTEQLAEGSEALANLIQGVTNVYQKAVYMLRMS